MKKQIPKTLLCLIISGAFSLSFFAQNAKKKIISGKVCGNPKISCGKNFNFQPYELGFNLNVAVAESEFFYAIILKTVILSPKVKCEDAVSEDERKEIQDLFPRNKVFALKCSEPGEVFYTNTRNNVSFMAVYAGRTRGEADKFLKTVQTAGKFTGVNLRKMKAGINGT